MCCRMPSFFLDNDTIIYDGVVSLKDTATIRSIGGVQYDRSRRAYRLPCTRESLALILTRLPEADISEDVFSAVARKEAVIADALHARESLSDAVLPVNGTPYQHQKQAFSMCMRLYGVMIP